MSRKLPPLYPLRFRPVYKDYLWGGDTIARRFRPDLPPGIYAESWEVSAHPDGMSVTVNGPLAGHPLAALVERYGAALVGARVGGGPFPLLVKLIDARERLSVQVHPDDEAAAAHGGEPKTEMWYVLDADPGASVFAGLAPGTDARRFRRALAEGGIVEVLRQVPVRAGDAVYIPGGRVHAIDRGCLILEVQQSSNTTYRIHDWGRVGADGRPRGLHLAQASRVINWNDTGEARVVPHQTDAGKYGETWEIHTSPYFRMEQLRLQAAADGPACPETFQVLFCAEGSAAITWDKGGLDLPAGVSCLVPAALGGFRLLPAGGPARLLRITVP